MIRGSPRPAPLVRDRSGTTAVEFALVGAVFLSMLLFTCQLGFYLYAQLSLDYATAYAARQMLTGNGRTGTVSASSFQNTTLCPVLRPLLNCANIIVNLLPVSDYTNVAPPSALLTNGQPNPAAAQFNVGQNASLMVMQVVYAAPNFLWPLFDASSGAIPIVSTAAYVNES